MILGYLLSLLGVAGLAVGVLWLTARLKRGGLLPAVDQPLRVVARHALGPGQSLLLVECDGERLLVGTGRGGPTLLHRVPPTARAEELPEGAGADFRNILSLKLRRAA